MKEYWIVKGAVTDTEAHPGAQLGDTEWQFSDGPPGERGSSRDYLRLEDGLADTAPAIYHWAPFQRFGVHRLSDNKFLIWDTDEQVWVDPIWTDRAKAQAFAKKLNDSIEVRTDEEDAQVQAFAEKLARVNEPMSVVKLDPDRADQVGRLLLMLVEANSLRHVSWVLSRMTENPPLFEEVATALIALGNDTDALVCKGED